MSAGSHDEISPTSKEIEQACYGQNPTVKLAHEPLLFIRLGDGIIATSVIYGSGFPLIGRWVFFFVNHSGPR